MVLTEETIPPHKPPPASSLVLGTFEVERLWVSPEVATLPSMPTGSSRLVAVMDELLLPLCERDDVLLTRTPLDDAHRQYADLLGLLPSKVAAVTRGASEDYAVSTEGLLLNRGLADVAVRRCIAACAAVKPYGVHADVHTLAEAMELRQALPPLEAVRDVNSKAFSKQLSSRLEPAACKGLHTTSMTQLENEARALLEQGPVLLKEDFGVSGSGNYLVKTIRRLDRLLKYLRQQMEQGRSLSLTVEPLLDKRQDFSCQLDIDLRGSVILHSVQMMYNDQFNYAGSSPASERFVRKLDKLGYFDVIEEAAGTLWRRGYHGPVCIDSMMLDDGSVVALVEINARFSMGRICDRLNGLSGLPSDSLLLSSFPVGRGAPLSFEELLDVLSTAGILIRELGEPGVLPLSSRMLAVRRDPAGGSHVLGRMLALLRAEGPEELPVLRQNFLHVLTAAGFSIYKPTSFAAGRER